MIVKRVGIQSIKEKKKKEKRKEKERYEGI